MGNYGRGNGLGYIILARAVLDAPGEWYSDGKEFIVIPPKGGGGAYELRTRLYGAVVTGDGVRLENIRFRGATARVDGNDVSFVKCAFEYTSPFSHNPNPEDEPRNKRGQSQASGWGIPENEPGGRAAEQARTEPGFGLGNPRKRHGRRVRGRRRVRRGELSHRQELVVRDDGPRQQCPD